MRQTKKLKLKQEKNRCSRSSARIADAHVKDETTATTTTTTTTITTTTTTAAASSPIMELFAGLRFVICVREDQLASLDTIAEQIREYGGAVVDPDDGDDDDDHGDPDDTVYHITTRPLSDVDRRRQINPLWVSDCIRAKKLLDADLYRPQDQFFYGKKFTTTDLTRPRRELIVSIVTLYGGEYSSDLLPDTTHLICSDSPTDKVSAKLSAARKRRSMTILSDLQFIDMIEEEYRKHLAFHGGARKIFRGMKFYIIHADESVIQAVKSHVEFGSGSVIPEPEKDAIIVCQFRATSNRPERFVTAQWVEDCIQERRLIPIDDENKYMYRSAPLSRDRTRRSDWIMSLTGFQDRARFDIQYLIITMGATYTGQLERTKNTHLIYDRPVGKKYEKAIEWGMEVHDRRWLEQKFGEWYDLEEQKLIKEDAQKQRMKDRRARVDNDTSTSSRKRSSPEEGQRADSNSISEPVERRTSRTKKRKLECDDDDDGGDDNNDCDEEGHRSTSSTDQEKTFSFYFDDGALDQTRLSDMIQKLGGTVVEDPFKETIDVLVTDRPPKLNQLSLMVMANCGFIVTSEYVEKSAVAGCLLRPERFEHSQFEGNELSQNDCLRKWRERYRKTGLKPLHNFYIISILSGKDKAAKAEERIVQIGGGRWFSKSIEKDFLPKISFAIADTAGISNLKREQMRKLKIKIVDRRYLKEYLISAGKVAMDSYEL